MSSLSKPISVRLPDHGRKKLETLADNNRQKLVNFVRGLIIDGLEAQGYELDETEFFPSNRR